MNRFSRRPLSMAIALAVTAALAAACADITPQKDRELTQAEHDSILATQTAIPGTIVVARALDAKERNARKTAALNAQIDSLTR